MPIINEADQLELVEAPNAVRIAAPEYRGVTVDSRYTPSASLLTHVEGSSWTVNYYSQVLDRDSAVTGQSLSRDAIYQQYTLVRDFEFKVTSPLASSQSDESKAMQLRGAANIYPFLVPNVGDMFLADMGDGREGIFRIVSSERRSVFKDTAHAIEYVWVDYSTPERRGDLNQKVIQSLYFVKDFLQYGQNPLLQEEDYAIARELASRYAPMAEQYFRTHLSHEYKTLVVPGQGASVYDPFLTKAVKSHFTTWDAKELQHVRALNTDGDHALASTTVWDVISQRDPRLFPFAVREAMLVSARAFCAQPMLEGIYWSGIRYVVYPKDPEVTVNYDTLVPSKAPAERGLVATPSRLPYLPDQVPQTALDAPTAEFVPLIHPVLIDSHYVFSQAFYQRAEQGQSQLELAVHDYLEGKAPNNRLLLQLCDRSQAWGPLERFYYLPVVLVLLKSSIRSL